MQPKGKIGFYEEKKEQENVTFFRVKSLITAVLVMISKQGVVLFSRDTHVWKLEMLEYRVYWVIREKARYLVQSWLSLIFLMEFQVGEHFFSNFCRRC